MEYYKLLSRREEEAAQMRAEAEKLVRAARAELEKTLSNERKTWKESWAKQNENLFRAHQELANLKAANAALTKEKAAAEAAAGRVKEDEACNAKALEEAKKAGARFANALNEANADRTRLNQTVVSLQAEVQTREAKLADITARVTVAEERANEVVEARDALTSSFNQLEADREWMRSHGIAHIVKAIMDAPETTIGIDLIKQRARDAGFKAGYNRCIGHINVLSQGGYTNERSGFRDVDTEALLEAAVASFYDMSFSSVEKLDECLDAVDYVDRLRMLYTDAE
ncbi:uncharacterized protein LOC118479604 [Helianthus annuus]|uniref:uncharacterized protein LOC118479604 n=1 Tax=Helianthus annuus TaxID=4232 RepID=UPI001652F1BB|nr:uncharacterized protein LOC118479604 [Helianthus annuus]